MRNALYSLDNQLFFSHFHLFSLSLCHSGWRLAILMLFATCHKRRIRKDAVTDESYTLYQHRHKASQCSSVSDTLDIAISSLPRLLLAPVIVIYAFSCCYKDYFVRSMKSLTILFFVLPKPQDISTCMTSLGLQTLKHLQGQLITVRALNLDSDTQISAGSLESIVSSCCTTLN